MSIVRSTLAGLATGGRTFSAISALTATVPRGTTEEPDRLLARPQTQFVLGLLATGEVLADKLPQAPSRLDFPGLQGRLLFGAVCGVVIARRSARAVPAEVEPGTPVAPGPAAPSAAKTAACAAVGAGAAYAGSVLGHGFRGWLDGKVGHDWIAALIEDGAVAALTTAAVAAPA